MRYKYARYSSLLNTITNEDKLFNGDYTLDPYQNCEYGCTYCDSTNEEVIYVKANAAQLLEKELGDVQKGVVIIGSVSDPYQKIEKKYRLTRGLLEIIGQYGFPVHILTKSDLILRDLDLLSKIDSCMVTISIATFDRAISDVFEKEVPPPLERLNTVEKLSETGIKTGLAVIPILPFIVEKELEEIVRLASKHKARYLLHKYLELKGDQRNIFMETLEACYPHLVEKYEKLYQGSYRPDETYISKINNDIDRLCSSYDIKNKINYKT